MDRPSSGTGPRRAMVLAAGLGVRMRPITDTIPKPLVEVAGRTLIDSGLDKLAGAGVETAVVNVHWLADRIETHLAGRDRPRIVISDERDQLLDTGGGVVRALPLLGADPFFVLNADTIWIDGPRPNLGRLGAAFDPRSMDVLLLVAPTATSIGYSERGDFFMDAEGRLARRTERAVAPFVYAGAAIVAPAVLADAPRGAFSLNRIFDAAIAAGRLFGLRLDGIWMHVGTPDAIDAAARAIMESTA